jgi:hypothetical protein
MGKKHFTEEQIVFALRRSDGPRDANHPFAVHAKPRSHFSVARTRPALG